MRWGDVAALLLWVAGSGCNAILGLNDLTVDEQSESANGAAGQAEPAVACSGNRECSERLTPAGSAQPTPAVCLQGERRCVQLTSEDCTTVTGDYSDDSAIVIASLFSTTGAQATTNLHRQQAATMAVSEINAAGGIPIGPTSAGGRPLVMVSCDEAANLSRVATHLVHELRVPAIVGPNTSQDTLDLSRMFSIEAGTLLISPTAVASSIEDLLDRDLTWLLVPSDVQRAPLMLDQINALERQLSEERGGRPLKLGVIYRDDALGIGTRVSLNELEFNGKALGDPSNLGSQVRMDGYDFGRSEQSELVDAHAAFAPDIVVLAGTAESITQIMLPLEARWPLGAPRPYYLLTDSSKVPELLMAAANDDDLRRRLRGTGVKPSPDSESVYNAFRLDYGSTFPDGSVTYSGMGPAYDASYALAYALAATYDSAEVTGASIARGLGRLSGGAAVVEIGRTTILAAFQALVAGNAISAVGTFAPLGWNDNGAVSRGTLEIWCVAAGSSMPLFRGSGLTFDIGKRRLSGAFQACEP